MRYLLRKSVIGSVPEIDITEAQYLEFQHAWKVLKDSLGIEETYEMLLSNYADLEREMHDATLSHMIHSGPGYSDFFQIKLSLNMRLVNVLTAARLYIDQLPHYVRNCLPHDESINNSIKMLFSKEYDGCFEYRFMEALRNYVQHRGTPVHWTSLPGGWTSFEENGELEFSLNMGSLRSVLQEDNDFKKSVLKEMDEKVDLKAATRCYIECISRVHCAARRMIAESSKVARALIEKAHKQYSEAYDGNLVGLSACAWSDEEDDITEISSVPLMLDWDDIRLRLIERNGEMVNLRKRYVTGRNVK
jgi:hypothetical protein